MANKLQVEAIKTGTVIDHIPAGQGMKILKRMELIKLKEKITVGFNLPSKNLGMKDLIKVANLLFTEEEANQLALFAPGATINVIENYIIKDKFEMSLPDVVQAAFDCPNSNCISHSEPVQSYFTVKQKNNDIQLKCKYCEKSFSKSIVEDL